MNGIWIWLPLASIAVINSKMFKNNILKRSKIYWGWFTNFHFRMIKRGSKKLEKGYSFVLPWFLCINNPEQVSSCIKHTCLKHLLHTFERAIIRGISRCRKNLFLLLIWILRTTCVDYHWPYILRQDVHFFHKYISLAFDTGQQPYMWGQHYTIYVSYPSDVWTFLLRWTLLNNFILY